MARWNSFIPLILSGLMIVGCQEPKRGAMAPIPSKPLGVAPAPTTQKTPDSLPRLADDPLRKEDSVTAGEASTSQLNKTGVTIPTRPSMTREPGPVARPRHRELSEPPQADETVTKTFQDDTQTIVVEAVCSLTESEVSCWDMDGKRNTAAEGLIKEAIARDMEEPYRQGVQIRLGFKNRLLLVKTTRKMSMGGPSSYAYIQGAGSNPMGYSGYGLNLRTESPRTMGGEDVRYETRMIAEKPTVNETRIRLNQTSHDPNTVEIPAKVGATVELAGYKVKIESIRVGAAQPGRPSEPGRKVWTVEISQTGSPAKKAMLNFMPMGDKNQMLSIVDKEGNPVPMDQYHNRLRDAGRNGQRPRDFFIGSAMGGMMRTGENSQLTLYVNPAKIPAFRVQAHYSRIIDITGIPMDPR